MAKRVTSFESTDGTLFDTEKKADDHDSWLQFLEWCNRNICIGGEWSADMVAREIFDNYTLKKKE